MASDVNKLVIMIETKGATTAKTDVDKLTDSSKKLGTQTKTTTEETSKFTSAMSAVPGIVAGVTAVVTGLATAYGSVEDAYVAQLSSQIKLEGILSTTSNAIGYNIDQIEVMTDAWRESTGIHQTVTRDLLSMAATFVTIGKENIPDMTQAALSMAEMFGQDLKQSVIQLGTSLSSPIEGLGRLRRIGITFNQEQRTTIKNLIEENDLLAAQRVIIDEVTRQTGELATKLGDSLVGDIRRADSAWMDFKANIGGDLSQLLNPLRKVFTEITEGINTIFTENRQYDSLKEKLSSYYDDLRADPAYAGMEISMESMGLPSSVTIQESTLAINEYENKLDTLQTKLERQRKYSGTGQSGTTTQDIANTEFYIKQTKVLLDLFEKQKSFRESLTPGAGTQDAIDPNAESKANAMNAYLVMIQKLIDKKTETNGLNELETNTEKEKLKYTNIANTLLEDGIALGLTELEIKEKLKLLTEQENILLTSMRTDEAEALKLTDKKLLVITEEQKAKVELETLEDNLNNAVARNNITQEEANQALLDYKESLKEVKEEIQEITAGSLGELLTAQLKDPFSDLDDIINWEETMTSSIDSVYSSLGQLADSAISTSLESIGAALYDASDASSDWESAMQSMVASTLTAVGPQLLLAGASALALPNGVNDPRGWALLAAGGAASIYGGYLNAYLGGSSDSDSDTDYVYTDSMSGTEIDDTTESDTITKGVTVNVTNNSTAEVTTTSSTATDGSKVVDFVLSAVESKYNVSSRTVPVGTK